MKHTFLPNNFFINKSGFNVVIDAYIPLKEKITVDLGDGEYEAQVIKSSKYQAIALIKGDK
jgi:hypothetical protein